MTGTVVCAAEPTCTCAGTTDPKAGCGLSAPYAHEPIAYQGPCAPGGPNEAGADAGPPSSCAPDGPGTTNCGPGGSGTESCCTSLEVTGGAYYRTYDLPPFFPPDGGPVNEADPATVSGFRLDKYLVTVGRFRQFVNAVLPADGGAGWVPPPGSGKHTHLNGGNGLAVTGGGYEPGWVNSGESSFAPTLTNLACDPNYATWTASVGNQENLPINCVTWYDAYAFCIWDGGFLPSEAEWEYVAAGGGQQRPFPWGSAAPGTTCPGTGCQYAIYNCDYPNGSGSCSGVANIAPVGTAPLGAGLWGQLDLAGGVNEWTLDWYAAYTACTDCANLATPTDCTNVSTPCERVTRGSAYEDSEVGLLPAGRGYSVPTYTYGALGFRCARMP
jgi:sulfatase modifying factor 1